MAARSPALVANPVRLVDDADSAATALGVSLRTFAELRKRPGFPAPIALLGPLRPRWRRADLVAYVENLPTIETQPEPASLRKGRAARKAKADQAGDAA